MNIFGEIRPSAKTSALLHLWGCSPDDAGERLNGIQEVSGSIPLISTTLQLNIDVGV